MKAAATMFASVLLGLAGTACSQAGPALPAATRSIEPDQAFSLRPGETAATRDGRWRVGFEGVVVDSRCPKGEVCVWAGDARVRVWLQAGGGPRQPRELHTAPAAAAGIAAQGPDLQLLRLDPLPVAGQPIPPSHYLATLKLRLVADATPDR